MRFLVVEDDRIIAAHLVTGLAEYSIAANLAATRAEALAALNFKLMSWRMVRAALGRWR